MPSASARPPVACPSIPALAVAAVAFLEALPPATAQARAEAAKIRIELNKTEQEGDACRVSLVFTNSGIDHYRGMTLDLVFLGKDDVILRRAAIDAAPRRAWHANCLIRVTTCEAVSPPMLGLQSFI